MDIYDFVYLVCYIGGAVCFLCFAFICVWAGSAIDYEDEDDGLS